MRFVVDHCAPAEAARWLASEGHQAWSAYHAGLADAADEDPIAYAHAKGAVLVTTNPRLRSTRSAAQKRIGSLARGAPILAVSERTVG